MPETQPLGKFGGQLGVTLQSGFGCAVALKKSMA
jgi:hypothetical protein